MQSTVLIIWNTTPLNRIVALDLAESFWNDWIVAWRFVPVSIPDLGGTTPWHTSAEPCINFRLDPAWIFFGETLTFLQIIGIILALAGIAWVVSSHEEPPYTPHGHTRRGQHTYGMDKKPYIFLVTSPHNLAFIKFTLAKLSRTNGKVRFGGKFDLS